MAATRDAVLDRLDCELMALAGARDGERDFELELGTDSKSYSESRNQLQMGHT